MNENLLKFSGTMFTFIQFVSGSEQFLESQRPNIQLITRITTFIKAKPKKLDEQTNIDKYTLYLIVSGINMSSLK